MFILAAIGTVHGMMASELVLQTIGNEFILAAIK